MLDFVEFEIEEGRFYIKTLSLEKLSTSEVDLFTESIIVYWKKNEDKYTHIVEKFPIISIKDLKNLTLFGVLFLRFVLYKLKESKISVQIEIEDKSCYSKLENLILDPYYDNVIIND